MYLAEAAPQRSKIPLPDLRRAQVHRGGPAYPTTVPLRSGRLKHHRTTVGAVTRRARLDSSPVTVTRVRG
eukprot:468383-Hanusia_phi.AAC.2